MKLRTWLMVATGGMGLAVLAWVGPRFWESKVTLARHRPALPVLTTWPAQAQDRMLAADLRARSVWQARRGMAELAKLYQANGFYDEALACYDGLRAVEPRNARWSYLPAVVLAGSGRLEAAEPLFRRAAELAPDYLPAHVRDADVLVKINRPDEAQRIYNEVLARFGEQPYALLGLARAAIGRNDWSGAESLLERSIAADPNFVPGLGLLATVYKQLGRDEDAKRTAAQVHYRESLEIKDPWVEELNDDCYNPYYLSVAAAVANFRREPELAKRWLERAVSLARNPAPYLRQLGQMGYLTRDYSEAAKNLAKAVELAPDDADAWTVWVNVLLAAGNRPEAYRVLANGISHCPESGALHYVYGHLLSEDGQLAHAIEELRVAKQFRSTQADVYIDLARAYFKSGQTDAGLAEMNEALKVQPDHPVALVVAARYAIDRGDLAAAREWIRRIRQQPRIGREDQELVLSEFQQKFGRNP